MAHNSSGEAQPLTVDAIKLLSKYKYEVGRDHGPLFLQQPDPCTKQNVKGFFIQNEFQENRLSFKDIVSSINQHLHLPQLQEAH